MPRPPSRPSNWLDEPLRRTPQWVSLYPVVSPGVVLLAQTKREQRWHAPRLQGAERVPHYVTGWLVCRRLLGTEPAHLDLANLYEEEGVHHAAFTVTVAPGTTSHVPGLTLEPFDVDRLDPNTFPEDRTAIASEVGALIRGQVAPFARYDHSNVLEYASRYATAGRNT